jgi:predicted O-methyltransferase YrrM
VQDRSATLAAASELEGWMTRAQGERLWDSAAAVAPGGTIVEIGSYRGKSAVVMASAAAPGVSVTAIDPHAGNDRGPQEIDGYADAAALDHEVFNRNLERAGVRGRVTHVRAFSSDAHDRVDGPIDLLYIDGAHQRRAALADIEGWGAKVREGGTMLIHDSFSSVGVTTAIATSLLYSRSWRYQGRSGSLAEYRRVPTSTREARRSTAEQLAALPWFLRNVGVKVLQALRLGRWTKVLGHEGSHPPF